MQDFLNNNYYTITNNIKNIRLENGLSQEKFSEKIDCTREFVNRLENHKEKPSLQMLLKIAYIFNKKPRYFFENQYK